MQKTEGLIAAPFTPFNTKGDPELSIIPAYAKKLASDGVTGVFVNGTTGEGVSLTLVERVQLAEEWIKAGRQYKLKVFVHVGAESLRDAQSLANHAAQRGADAIAMMSTVFFKPSSVDELIKHCEEVASIAPSLPFYYYNIPSMTGVNFPMFEFLKKAEKQISNLAGIKYTYENIMDYSLCLDYKNSKYDMLFGRDEILLSALIMGAKAAVGSTYNYAAPVYLKMMETFNSGKLKEAKYYQMQAIRMIEVLIKYGGGVAAGKGIMKHAGLDVGFCREPLKNLSDDQLKEMKEDLIKADFFER